jgi:hypothetical protein
MLRKLKNELDWSRNVEFRNVRCQMKYLSKEIQVMDFIYQVETLLIITHNLPSTGWFKER